MEPVLSSPFPNDIPQNLLRTGRCVIRATISCNRLEGWTGVSGESPVNYYMSFSEIMLVFLCLHPDGLLEAVTAGVLYKVALWLGGEHSTTNNDHNAHSYLIIYRHFKLFTERAS